MLDFMTKGMLKMHSTQWTEDCLMEGSCASRWLATAVLLRLTGAAEGGGAVTIQKLIIISLGHALVVAPAAVLAQGPGVVRTAVHGPAATAVLGLIARVLVAALIADHGLDQSLVLDQSESEFMMELDKKLLIVRC